MKAVRYASYGGPEVLELVDIDKPIPASDEVLVRVKAVGINPVDWRIRDGSLRHFFEAPFPVVPGGEISGTVERADDREDVLAGQEVFALLGTMGALAEYVVVPRNSAVPKPITLDHIHAAATPLAALTAWQALFDHGEAKKGERVLIHAAAGGVGGFAVQFAAIHGAHVIATASQGKHEYVRSLGAAEVVDYRAEPFETRIGQVDLVIDLVGGDVFERSKAVLAPGGRIVTALGIGAGEANVRQVFVAQNPDQLAQIAALIDRGAIRVRVDHQFGLDQVGQAMELSKAGGISGKIVIDVVQASAGS
jgi:NADPH:quinone reductase-like Zn-dependent oxidoreductase